MNIVNIIVKKNEGCLTEQEQLFFENWINESEENRFLFNRLQIGISKHGEDQFLRSSNLNEEFAWNEITKVYEELKLKDKNKFKLSSIYPYAAILVIALISVTFLWKYNWPTSEKLNYEEAITLQLDDGQVKVIPPESNQTVIVSNRGILSSQNGNQIDYSVSTGKEKGLVFNVLKVPKGKLFKVVLSDGTRVILNAESSLKYPVSFIHGKNRHVFLTGEGYFDVVKDANHPFIVSSEDLDIRVLGTKFNVSAYPENREINTVLVEGSVNLTDSSNEYGEVDGVLLEPGYMAEWDRFYKKMAFDKVDTNIYTGWIDGKLIIKETKFEKIIKKLERHYNVQIESNYLTLNHQIFTASFTNESIEEVLRVFSKETPFEFEFIENRITINAPNI